MRAFLPLISTLILLAGKFQSAPLLELNHGLGDSDGLVGGLKHTFETLAVTIGLDDGATGHDVGVSTDGVVNDSKLKKRLSLPRFGGLESFVDETKTKAQWMASGLGSKLSGLLRKRDSFSTFSGFDSALMKIPFLGYIPGIATLAPITTLPIIRSFPGLSLIPGLGNSTAPSGLIADLTEPFLSAWPRRTTLHSSAQNSTAVASPRSATIQSPTPISL